MKKNFIFFNDRKYPSENKLTVFLVAYNHEKTIRDTIESILKQTTKYPFVVKILDDYSTDNTVKICKEYVEKYPHVFKLIAQQKNTHCEHIKWAMLSEIDTPYWCFIEGDDYYINPDFFDAAIKFMDINPDYNMFTGNFKIREINDVFSFPLKKRNDDQDLSLDDYFYCQTATRIYRNIFDFSKMQDYPFIYDMYLYILYLHVGKSWFWHEFVSVYRHTNSGAWVHLSDKQQKKEARYVIKKLLSFFGYAHARAFIKIYPKRTMKRLSKILGAYITIRIINLHEKIFNKK